VTHGKGSIAPYFFINNEIIPIVTDQSMDQSNFSFIFSLSVLNYIIIINPTGIQPYWIELPWSHQWPSRIVVALAQASTKKTHVLHQIGENKLAFWCVLITVVWIHYDHV
jgi:hypothetical protein